MRKRARIVVYCTFMAASAATVDIIIIVIIIIIILTMVIIIIIVSIPAGRLPAVLVRVPTSACWAGVGIFYLYQLAIVVFKVRASENFKFSKRIPSTIHNKSIVCYVHVW